MSRNDPDFTRMPSDFEVSVSADRARSEAETALASLKSRATAAEVGVKEPGVPDFITYRITYLNRVRGAMPEQIIAHLVEYQPGFVVFHMERGSRSINADCIIEFTGGQ